jgi:copper transport protein
VRRLVALLALVAGLLGAGLLAAPQASAHAVVVASDPVDSARLAAAPATVSVTFNEPVGLGPSGYLRVIDQVGRRVDTGSASHPNGDGRKISVALKSGLGAGTFTASFRVLSADSHPVAASLRFVVGNGALAAATTGPSTVNGLTSTSYDVIRWVSFAGLAGLAAGWLLFTVWPAGRDDRRARRLVWTGWGVTTVGAVAELLVQGPYVAGTGLGDVRKWGLLDATLHTTFGGAHSVRLLLLGALGLTLWLLLRDSVRSSLQEVAGLLGLGVVLTFAFSGHASTQDPRWLATISDTVHLAAMAGWLGGLMMLVAVILPNGDADELRTVLPVFSRVAFGCVALLAVTGTYQAWLGVGSWSALTGTRYGQLVLVKIIVFAVLLALGNLSRVAVQRRWVRPVAYAMAETETGTETETAPAAEQAGSDESTGAPEVRRLRWTVAAEVLLALAVLAVTAVLVAEPPGRSVAEAAGPPTASAVASLGGGRTTTVAVTPGRHGPVTVSVTVSSGPAIQQVTCSAELSAQQLGPIAVPVVRQPDGRYQASGVLLPSAGRWQFTITVKTSEFDNVFTDVTIPLS